MPALGGNAGQSFAQGGITLVAQATGLSRTTITSGIRELRQPSPASGQPLDPHRSRHQGGGPPSPVRATAEDLQRLPGIGPKLSARIVETRAQGSFKSADELRRVPGIGPNTLEKLRPLVTAGNSVAQAPEK